MSRNTRRLALIPALLSAAVLLTACDGDTRAQPEPVKTVKVTVTPTPTSSPTSAGDAFEEAQKDNKKAQDDLQASIDAAREADGKALLPDMTGKDLQAAQDGAQAAGFFMLMEEDATGQGRIPLWDRNWTVCSQTPAAGEHDPDTEVTFHVVKDTESC